MRVEQVLDEEVSRHLGEVVGEPTPALIKLAQDSARGDYQINGLLPLAKKRKEDPLKLAKPLIGRLEKSEIFEEVSFAAPGFVNLRLSSAWTAEIIEKEVQDVIRDGVPTQVASKSTIIDYSSPNVAKQMHVGHLRSTILGESLARLLEFLGDDVHRDNHLGDYGTQFGLLIAGIDRFHRHVENLEDLEKTYQEATALAKEEPAFAAQGREELAKLQQGDARNQELWQRFVTITRKDIDQIYGRLGVHFDSYYGESWYAPMLPKVIETLLSKSLAREDQGALCVFFEDHPELKKHPFLVRKQDEAYLYSTSDVATIMHRADVMKAQRCLYVVDARQTLYFKQLFEVARRLGYACELEHIAFGSVLGADGKPLKTREGKPITLGQLLNEAEQRAKQLIISEEIDLGGQDPAQVARVVGIGAVKYADLKQNRLSDYRFDWEKLISLKGHAGPYVQYAFARICSIFRKAGIEMSDVPGGPVKFATEHELALAKVLIRLSDVLFQAAQSYQPHLIAEHAYQLARSFSAFYEHCPILQGEADTRESRLRLSAFAARQLRRSLHLLGIGVLERM